MTESVMSLHRSCCPTAVIDADSASNVSSHRAPSGVSSESSISQLENCVITSRYEGIGGFFSYYIDGWQFSSELHDLSLFERLSFTFFQSTRKKVFAERLKYSCCIENVLKSIDKFTFSNKKEISEILNSVLDTCDNPEVIRRLLKDFPVYDLPDSDLYPLVEKALSNEKVILEGSSIYILQQCYFTPDQQFNLFRKYIETNHYDDTADLSKFQSVMKMMFASAERSKIEPRYMKLMYHSYPNRKEAIDDALMPPPPPRKPTRRYQEEAVPPQLPRPLDHKQAERNLLGRILDAGGDQYRINAALQKEGLDPRIVMRGANNLMRAGGFNPMRGV